MDNAEFKGQGKSWEVISQEFKQRDQELLDKSSDKLREDEGQEELKKRQGEFLGDVFQYALSEEGYKINEYYPGPKVIARTRELLKEDKFAKFLKPQQWEIDAVGGDLNVEATLDEGLDAFEAHAQTRRLQIASKVLTEKGNNQGAVMIGLLALATKDKTRTEQRQLIGDVASDIIDNLLK